MAEEILVERLPMYVNLGDIGSWGSQIGWARIVRDPDTGRNKIEIDLDEESSKQLGDMTEAFKLKAVGFAGIKVNNGS
jgi:hypothetical protein